MRKRSAYRPKGANPLAHLMAIQGAALLSKSDALLRAELLAMAVSDITKGDMTSKPWTQVFDGINMAEEWCRMGIADGLGAIEELQTVILAVWDRHKATKSTALYADEVKALREFVGCYVDLLQGVTHQQYFRAQMAVEERTRRVLAGERMAVARVVSEATA